MKIIITAFSNLTTDQRILKTCDTLHRHYDILLIGNDWGDNSPLTLDYPYERIKLRSKILRRAYLEFNYKLYHKLISITRKGDVLYANDLDAVLPSYLLHKTRKNPLVLDNHEIFTEMPSLQGRWVKQIWKFLEKQIYPHIRHSITESESYAEWFQHEYGMKPHVVRNVPRYRPAPEIRNFEPKKIIYQGVLNPYRGLEPLIQSMEHLQEVQLHIAGDGPLREALEKRVKQRDLGDKVIFHGKLKPEELEKFTATADLGVSLEENGGISYLYSLPNKVSDYIQARVPILTINFPEMIKVHQKWNIGEMVDNHLPISIAIAAEKILNRGRTYYAEELQRAAEELCWEKDEQKILLAVQNAIQDQSL